MFVTVLKKEMMIAMKARVLRNPIDPENATRTTHMNGDRYNWLVRSKFADWRNCSFPDGKPVFLFQDYERCLWQDWDLENL